MKKSDHGLSECQKEEHGCFQKAFESSKGCRGRLSSVERIEEKGQEHYEGPYDNAAEAVEDLREGEN